MLISATPNPAPLPKGEQATVKARASFRGVKFGDNIDRMKEIMGILYGKGSGVAVTFTWTPTMAVQDRDWEHIFTFKQPGVYPVAVKLEIAPYSLHSETEPRIMLRRTLQSFVDVEVGVTKVVICKSCGKPIGTTPGCLMCTLHKHDPTTQVGDPTVAPHD